MCMLVILRSMSGIWRKLTLIMECGHVRPAHLVEHLAPTAASPQWGRGGHSALMPAAHSAAAAQPPPGTRAMSVVSSRVWGATVVGGKGRVGYAIIPNSTGVSKTVVTTRCPPIAGSITSSKTQQVGPEGCEFLGAATALHNR